MRLTFESASDLARALARAADAHGQHEKQIGHPDPDWPDWYAAYLEREQAGPGHEQAGPGREQAGHEPASPAGRGGAPVTVAVVTTRTEAELIVGMLRNNDLRAVVSADDAGGQEPQLQAQGVRVLVAPADEARGPAAHRRSQPAGRRRVTPDRRDGGQGDSGEGCRGW